MSGRVAVGLLAVQLAALAACQEENVQVGPAMELAHANGLRVDRPPGFAESATANGFSLDEKGDIRSPRSMTIELVVHPPAVRHPEERSLPNGGVAGFAVREVGAGSAGTEYELSASQRIGDRWIALRATAQSEDGQPDFAVAWRVLERARLSAAR